MNKANYLTEYLSTISSQKENITQLYNTKRKFADKWKISALSFCISFFLLIVGFNVELFGVLKIPNIFFEGLACLFFTSLFSIFIGISLDERNMANRVDKLNEINDSLFLKLKEDKALIKELSLLIIDDASKDLFLQFSRSLAVKNNKKSSLDLFHQLVTYKEKQQNIQVQKNSEATALNQFLSDVGYNEPTVVKQQSKEKFLGML